MLAALGYTRVREYRAGKKDWRDAGLPMERNGQPETPSSLRAG